MTQKRRLCRFWQSPYFLLLCNKKAYLDGRGAGMRHMAEKIACGYFLFQHTEYGAPYFNRQAFRPVSCNKRFVPREEEDIMEQRNGYTPAQYEYIPRKQNGRATKKKAGRGLAITALFLSLSLLLCLALIALELSLGQIALLPPVNNVPVQGITAPSFSIDEIPEDTDDGLSTTEIARTVGPSVVAVNVYMPQMIGIAGSGSGIVLNKEGYIVTNAHVISGASAVSVTLDDGRTFDARVIGRDTRTDLAVLHITADALVPASFGKSDALEVGERAVAIGNAVGELAGSVTQGIISGLNREIRLQGENGVITMRLIQTDAAINPGNSGGALVNRYGQVVGINSAKLANVLYEGLGFAIPIHEAQPIIDTLIANGYVGRAVLGVTVLPLTAVDAATYGLPSHGMYISGIEPYSDLPHYDITVGDVILEANGVQLNETNDLLQVLDACTPGDTLHLKIHKGGSGNLVEIDVLTVESRQ